MTRFFFHNRSLLLRAGLLAAVVLVLAACSLAGEPVPAGPIETGPMPGEEVVAAAVPVEQPRASEGERIYLENCVACHGPSGSGDGQMSAQLAEQGAQLPNLSDRSLARMTTPAEWYQIITNGRMTAMMPPWQGSLTDAERWDVTYYLYTLSVSEETLAEGEALYDEHFAGQFGAQGEEIGLEAPADLVELSQQQIAEDYLVGSDADLTDEQMWAVAAYMQTFGYDPLLPAVALEPPGLGDAGAEAGEAAEEPGLEEEAAADEPPAEGETPAEDEAPPEGEAADEEPQLLTMNGVVSGQVQMATAGESLPEGLEVSLRGIAIDENNAVYDFMDQTQTADASGAFRFEELPTDVPRAAYVVEVIYNGVTFQNGVLLDPEQPSMELPLSVYASTSDPSAVSVDAMHVVFNEHPDALLVTQLYVFTNTTDRIYVTEEPIAGGRRGSVAISLPEGAYGTQFQDGEIGGRFIPVDDRYYDLDQLLPGQQSSAIIVNYFLPYDGAADIEIPILYDTQQVTVLAEGEQRARSEQLSEAGTEIIEEQAYTSYVGQDLASGDTLALNLRTQAGGVSDILPIALAAAAGVLLVAGVAYWLYQRREFEFEPEPEAAGPAYTGRADELIDEIARLDEAYEAGRVDRFEYESRRAALKAELAAELQGEG